jgi:hypothetical protein
MNAPIQIGDTAQRFERFHRDNPDVYETLVRLVQVWVDQFGLRRLGVRMLWEKARWELIVATNTPDYKLNDHYTPYYVRLMIHFHPEWDDLFETRRSPADTWVAVRTGLI